MLRDFNSDSHVGGNHDVDYECVPTNHRELRMESMQPTGDGILHAIISLIIGSGTVMSAVVFRIWKKLTGRIDALEQSHVTRSEFTDLAVRLAAMASRNELAKHMKEYREEKQKMHEENLDAIRDVRAELSAVHRRVDQLFQK